MHPAAGGLHLVPAVKLVGAVEVLGAGIRAGLRRTPAHGPEFECILERLRSATCPVYESLSPPVLPELWP